MSKYISLALLYMFGSITFFFFLTMNLEDEGMITIPLIVIIFFSIIIAMLHRIIDLLKNLK
ncbi:hypothetical protein J2S17_000561 [Cytobacillus purgationiresistens]|uniref:Uncharacterized protein n=1 Tax=Cytobacillus purgationiresistens TaxID=863449 RepID=A0ABU0ABR1_9BACI|nr:hypothetical protein [Cytobacillus purgationiresistens]